MYVTVKVEQGTLRGQQKASEFFSHKKYYSFQSIPYAKPPLGALRFKDPEEPESWSGTHDALKDGNDCTQNHFKLNSPIGSEDCLYLNVYTPQMNGHELPVMVWIHGGAFVCGSGSSELHGPDYFMEQNIVLVTVNYRLHVLGFLCLDHDDVPGNAGLKDQVFALRWVQKNIAKFGGDPNNVTIFGGSAGGVCVHYHLLSPLSQGLFHRAIIQSGSTLDPWALRDKDKAINRAFRIGKALGCDTKDTKELLQFLREVPAIEFVKLGISIVDEDEVLLGLPLLSVPCVEVPATSESFLSTSPRELLKQGRFSKVPTIMGSTSDEGIISLVTTLNEQTIEKEYERLEKGILHYLGLSVDSEKAIQVSKDIKRFYFNDEPITMDKLNNYCELYGDLTFEVGIDEALRIMVNNEETPPIYTYEFTGCLSESLISTMIRSAQPSFEIKGASHGEEISALFSNSITGVRKPSLEDEKFIAKVTKLWATFARTGNPNFEGMETTWDPVTKTSFCHLDIGKELKLVTGRVKEQRMELWQKMYEYSSNIL